LKATEEEWKKDVPADLIPAVQFLRELIYNAHRGSGGATQEFCYALLHDETPSDTAKMCLNMLLSNKAWIRPAARRRFDHLIKGKNPPAIFKAFYDLYLESVSVTTALVFDDLMKIGHANRSRFGVPFWEWAKAQAKHLIHSYPHRIESWVREVCDKRVYNPHEHGPFHLDEWSMWRNWEAPSLVMMTPSRYRPHDPVKYWERNDPETSSRWLKSFEDDFVRHLEGKIEGLLGPAVLHLSKQPQLTQPSTVSAGPLAPKQEERGAGTPTPVNPFKPRNGRREARKLETRNKHERWRKEYRRLVRKYPGQTDLWYSRKISQMSVAEGSSPETIRKHMTK
jgi:hypothetical protein